MGRWVQRADYSLGVRLTSWNGDTNGAATSFPDGTLAVVSSDVVARKFHLWAYSPDGGDFTQEIAFNLVSIEPGTVFPTNRLDPQGLPVVFFHGGQIKFLIKLWNGGGNGPSPLARVYTNIFWMP